jgi:hypothetical protein
MSWQTLEVEVYRLWKNGTWDKVTIEISDMSLGSQPWDNNAIEIIESRAVQKAWLDLSKRFIDREKPVQIGLYMPSVLAVRE